MVWQIEFQLHRSRLGQAEHHVQELCSAETKEGQLIQRPLGRQSSYGGCRSDSARCAYRPSALYSTAPKPSLVNHCHHPESP